MEGTLSLCTQSATEGGIDQEPATSHRNRRLVRRDIRADVGGSSIPGKEALLARVDCGRTLVGHTNCHPLTLLQQPANAGTGHRRVCTASSRRALPDKASLYFNLQYGIRRAKTGQVVSIYFSETYDAPIATKTALSCVPGLITIRRPEKGERLRAYCASGFHTPPVF